MIHDFTRVPNILEFMQELKLAFKDNSNLELENYFLLGTENINIFLKKQIPFSSVPYCRMPDFWSFYHQT